ncbi:MAG TPA: hypothetical protein PLQ67_04760 [Burkholderiaceae bacterium]|nr:hypothetical protein [Burkholderiaceae bacterium]
MVGDLSVSGDGPALQINGRRRAASKSYSLSSVGGAAASRPSGFEQRVERELQNRVIELEVGKIGYRGKNHYRVGDVFAHILRIPDSSALSRVHPNEVHSYLTKGQAFNFNAIMQGIAQHRARIEAQPDLTPAQRAQQLLEAPIRFDHYDIGRAFTFERPVASVLTLLGVDRVDQIWAARHERFAAVQVGDLIDLPDFIQRIEAKKMRIAQELSRQEVQVTSAQP